MSDALIKAIAFAQAYSVTKESCHECGMPATKQVTTRDCYLRFACDTCTIPNADEQYDLHGAKGVRALMKVARGE